MDSAVLCFFFSQRDGVFGFGAEFENGDGNGGDGGEDGGDPQIKDGVGNGRKYQISSQRHAKENQETSVSRDFSSRYFPVCFCFDLLGRSSLRRNGSLRNDKIFPIRKFIK